MTPDFHESEQIERSYHDRLAIRTRGILISDETREREAKRRREQWHKLLDREEHTEGDENDD